MKIIENQNLLINNLVNYSSNIKKSDILELIKFISDNLHVLDLELNGNIIFSLKSEENDRALFEILIPVKGKVMQCNEFSHNPVFKLVNAISIRHEGALDELCQTTHRLKEYISENNYSPATKPYYIVIRESDEDSGKCIIDVFIGLNQEKK